MKVKSSNFGTRILTARKMFLTVRNMILTIYHRAVEILYPPCCPFCDQVLHQQEKKRGICILCQKELVYITENHCMKCGKQLYGERQEYCFDCSRRAHAYDGARALLSYQGKTKASLHRFKMANRRMYATIYAKELKRMLGRWMDSLHVDYLIPIPLYWKKERKRGYNQASILAVALSQRMKIPCLIRALYKHTETKAQKDLDAKQRQKNLEAAFVLQDEDTKQRLNGKCVLLVDDIYTTGGTVDAAASVLKKAGVIKVYVITVASGG